MGKVGDINISQTSETGKDKQVPDVFQPFGNHLLFKDDFYFVLCQIPPIHFLQTDFIIGEWVAYQDTVITGYQDNAFEELHELGSRVITTFTGGTQIQLEVCYKHRSDFINGNIRYIVFALNKLGKVAAGHFVFTIGGNRLGYADQLFHIVIVLFEKV